MSEDLRVYREHVVIDRTFRESEQQSRSTCNNIYSKKEIKITCQYIITNKHNA